MNLRMTSALVGALAFATSAMAQDDTIKVLQVVVMPYVFLGKARMAANPMIR